MQKYRGNCPESVRKDAKYHIRYEKQQYVVGITYTTENGEYWTPSTQEHPRLVEMVNEVKSAYNIQKGGSFYINEFRQVIVPAGGEYFCAGEYRRNLSFMIRNFLPGKDVEISGKPYALDGHKLRPGEPWEGCLMGIPYVLAAGGKDIRFEIRLSPNHFRRIPLSKVVSPGEAMRLASRLCKIIGDSAGGRFYINDQREMFKPVTQNGEFVYIYLGRLEETDPWFDPSAFTEEI